MDVNDVLEANQDNLFKVYQSFFVQIRKYMNLSDCQLLDHRCQLGISEKEVQLAYGLSKMTVENENTKGSQYQKMLFVEFLEFIGRLAHSKYKADDNLTLAQKIEFLLDDIFLAYNMSRNDVEITIEEISESDDEY